MTFLVHAGAVLALAAAPDGSFASAGRDKLVKITCPLSGTTRATLRGHTAPIMALVCTGHTLISGSADASIRVWDLASAACMHILTDHTDAVSGLCVVDRGDQGDSGSGALAASCSHDGTVRLWDAQTWLCRAVCREHRGPVMALCAVPGGSSDVVSAGKDGTLRVWDTARGTCRLTLVGHDGAVLCVCATDSMIASGSADARVMVWDLSTGVCLRTLSGHGDWIRAVFISGATIFSASDDKTVRRWDRSDLRGTTSPDLPRAIESWRVTEVIAFLSRFHFNDCLPAFAKHNINGASFKIALEEDLTGIGISPLHARAICRLRDKQIHLGELTL